MTPESSLLHALLAHHLGFATRERLLEAAFAWADDEATPLLDGLGLTTSQRNAVEQVAVALMEKYGNDATRALASTPVDAGVQRALLGLRLPQSLQKILETMKPRAGSADERYRFGAEIGRGGLGRVVEALDSTLGRDVAIKLVLPELPAVLQERFAREARLTAKLDHPHIVPVHDFGEIPAAPSTGPGQSRKQLFLCMKRVRGRSLAEVLAQLARGEVEAVRKWSRARLLGVLQDICLGVAYAHSKGIIHRDLKPSNVMLGDFGETLILDWGLARETGDPPEAEPGMRTRLRAPKVGSSTLTMEGDVLGTPAYMPPEQANGRLNDMDARSDVFSLGAILFELLTFRPPYQASTPDDVLALAQAASVPLPSSIAKDVPRELDAICARAMAGRREARYPTALALHHDLQQFLEGVAEKDRKRVEADGWVKEANALSARVRALRDRLLDARQELTVMKEDIPRSAPIEKRRLIWAAEESYEALRRERATGFSRAETLFTEALAADPGRPDAIEGRVELYLERYLEAEERRNASEMAVQMSLLQQIDPEGRHRVRLAAPGTLTLEVFEYACDCLRLVAPGVLRVEFAPEATIPWRDGAPVPGAAMVNKDRPIPAVLVASGGAPVGHRENCARKPVPGVVVSISRYVEQDRRLVPEPETRLGIAPLRNLSLPQGSYRCRLTPPADSGLAPTFVPVRVDRGGAWNQDVALYRTADIPAGFVQIPGGRFLADGGDVALVPRIARDVFFAPHHVTCAEYLAFLNDVFRTDPEGARRRVPRAPDRRMWPEDRKGFRLPAAGEDKAFDWKPEWPTFSISWFDAAAFVAWKSAREGRLYSLHHEEEFDKAARGVDGRKYAFGDYGEQAWFHSAHSYPDRKSPMPVGTFATDVSPYGVRDATGAMGSWCLNAPEIGSRDMRIIRGTGWWSNDDGHGITQRFGGQPDMLRLGYGMRICWRPWAWAQGAANEPKPPRASRKKTRE
ncbi:MAG: protein kinase [Planctomycetota bacterium]